MCVCGVCVGVGGCVSVRFTFPDIRQIAFVQVAICYSSDNREGCYVPDESVLALHKSKADAEKFNYDEDWRTRCVTLKWGKGTKESKHGRVLRLMPHLFENDDTPVTPRSRHGNPLLLPAPEDVRAHQARCVTLCFRNSEGGQDVRIRRVRVFGVSGTSASAALAVVNPAEQYVRAITSHRRHVGHH